MSSNNEHVNARRKVDASVLHFSVDDVFDTLIESTQAEQPLFHHPKLSFFLDLIERFGAEIDLYLFYRSIIGGRPYTLEIVGSFEREISTLAPAVHFGPHALDYYHAPYDQTPEEQMNAFDKIYSEIDRFAGSAARSSMLRLHYYSESFELAQYFKAHGAHVLFSTDRESGAHRLPRPCANSLLETGETTYEGQHFMRTHLRLEFMASHCYSDEELTSILKQLLEKYGRIVLYTHECELADARIRELLVRIYRLTDAIINGD